MSIGLLTYLFEKVSLCHYQSVPSSDIKKKKKKKGKGRGDTHCDSFELLFVQVFLLCDFSFMVPITITIAGNGGSSKKKKKGGRKRENTLQVDSPSDGHHICHS